MDRGRFEDWIDGYERAWRTPGTDLLGELFADDATYSTAPFEAPFRGLEAIREMWEREREGPDEPFTMTKEIVAVDGDTGVARLEVSYSDPTPHTYRDVWVVRFDYQGRCMSFEEWPFWPEGSRGGYASGPNRG